MSDDETAPCSFLLDANACNAKYGIPELNGLGLEDHRVPELAAPSNAQHPCGKRPLWAHGFRQVSAPTSSGPGERGANGALPNPARGSRAPRLAIRSRSSRCSLPAHSSKSLARSSSARRSSARHCSANRLATQHPPHGGPPEVGAPRQRRPIRQAERGSAMNGGDVGVPPPVGVRPSVAARLTLWSGAG